MVKRQMARAHVLVWLLALGLCDMHAVAWSAEPLSLEQAWQRAEQASPKLRAARAELIAAEGRRSDAQAWLWNNPEVSAELRSRRITEPGVSGTRTEGGLGIAQTFEIAGQQRLRRTAAEQNLSALQASIADARRQVRAEVEQRFVHVLSLQLRIETETQGLRLIEEAAAMVQKRVKAGQDSKLDGNLANIEAQRARNELAGLREQLVESRAQLSESLQLAPETLPEVVGSLSSSRSYTLEGLLKNIAQHPALHALAQREHLARSQLALERTSVYPDVTVGLSLERERGLDGRDNITALSASIPLPLFRKNATGIGQANAALNQVQIERQTTLRDVQAQVRTFWTQVQSLSARVANIESSILPSLEENQRLSMKALRAGEIGLPQLLLVNRQVVDGRRDLLDAQTALRLTKASLEAAAGWPPVPGVSAPLTTPAPAKGVKQ